MLRDRSAHFNYLDRKSAGSGSRFWSDLPPVSGSEARPSSTKAHQLIIDLVQAHPGEMILVMVGALTNLALALLVAPEIAPLIQGVVHMGGSFVPREPEDGPLNWNTPDIPDEIWRSVLRFNTLFDPEASAVVFNSGVPVTLVPVNVTAQVFQRLEALDRLEKCMDAYHTHLWRYGRPWVVWSNAERRLPGAHMHDPLALATVIDPTLCRYRSMNLNTVKLLAGDPGWLETDGSGSRVQVAVAVEARRFETLLARRLLLDPLPDYDSRTSGLVPRNQPDGATQGFL
jgi:purine nucleosidase